MRLTENTGRKKSCPKSPSGHHRTTLSGYIFATKAHIDNRKKLVKHQYLLHMSSQYGKLRPTNGWHQLTSLGHPCKFQLVSHLGSITAGHLVVGVSHTLRCWTEGTTYIRQGDHHVGHWPAFLVLTCILQIVVSILLPLEQLECGTVPNVMTALPNIGGCCLIFFYFWVLTSSYTTLIKHLLVPQHPDWNAVDYWMKYVWMRSSN